MTRPTVHIDDEPDDGLSSEDQAALVMLVDGRLDPEARAELERRAEGEPALAAAMARQRQGAGLIAAAVQDNAAFAPASLREAIDRASAQPAAPRRRRRLGWFALPGLAGGLAAVAFVAIVLAGGGGLTVTEVAEAATRDPQAQVRTDPSSPALLQESVDGVRFPNYLQKFGWRAVGTRTDRIDGRTTRSVVYEKDGKRIAYAIVDGRALERPNGQKETGQGGVEYRVLTAAGRLVITWERGGHTCVISAPDDGSILASELFELADWRAKGALDF